MKSRYLLLSALMAAQIMAQSSDILSSLASEAYSVFTSFTADQPQASSTVSTSSISEFTSTSQTSTDSSSAVSTSSSPASSSISSAASSTFSSSSRSSTSQTGSAVAASASGTAAAVSNSSSNSHNRTLAIVLGTVLGALALGLLILVLLLLIRRKNNRRGTVRNGYHSPSSDSTFEAHKTATSHVTSLRDPSMPTKPESLHSRNHIGPPSMSERTHQDVPFPHKFHDADSIPFVPGTSRERRSLHDPDLEHDGTWYTSAEGLSSHPVRRNHRDGSEAAAGLMGTAAGVGAVAAASRHPRHRGYHEAAPLESNGTHAQYLDGPHPSRSPHRASMESAKRRSGSMPRTHLRRSQDHIDSSLSGNASGDDIGRAAVRRSPKNHSRGRAVPAAGPSRHRERPNSYSPFPGQGIIDGLPAASHGPHEMSATPTPPLSKGDVNPLDANIINQKQANGSYAAGTKPGTRPRLHSRSHSRPRSYPPLPPALTIPQAKSVQPPRIPSRSPKRARFADKDTYHEPKAYANSPDLKHSHVSSPAQQPSPWTPTSNSHTVSTGTPATEDLVSPISPEDPPRSFNGVAIAPARANLIHHIPRSRDPSPQPYTQNNDGTWKNHSGLVNAVQTHFTPNHSQSDLHQRPEQQQLYTNYPIGNDYSGSSMNHNPGAELRHPRALTRKPVPGLDYSNNTTAMANSQENWWRTNSYGDERR